MGSFCYFLSAFSKLYLALAFNGVNNAFLPVFTIRRYSFNIFLYAVCIAANLEILAKRKT